MLRKQFRGKLSADFKNIKTRKQPWSLNTIACCYVKRSIRQTKKKPPATISVISIDLLHLKKEVDSEKTPGKEVDIFESLHTQMSILLTFYFMT